MIKREDRKRLFENLKKKFNSQEEIELLTEKYAKAFESLSRKQIYIDKLVRYIVASIIGNFESQCYRTEEEKKEIAYFVRNAHDEMSLELLEKYQFNQSLLSLYYLNKKDSMIIDLFENNGLQVTKEIIDEITKFLELAKEVTKEMGALIGNTVLNSTLGYEKSEGEKESWVSKVKGKESPSELDSSSSDSKAVKWAS